MAAPGNSCVTLKPSAGWRGCTSRYSVTLLLLSFIVPVAGGLLCLALSSRPRLATWLGVGGVVVGCVIGLVPAAQALLGAETFAFRRLWSVPYGEFSIALDPLSSLFLIVTLGLSLVAALFGGPYMLSHRGGRFVGRHWLLFASLVVSMALLVVARNGILFLVAWEAMAIAAFFLVTTDDEKPEVRSAGWAFLAAAHVGTAFLLAMFALLGRQTGSLDFDDFAALQGLVPATASTIFVLAVIGFGVKAGFVPLHVWLPEAHPAAPSHVSALMSGVMIKTGIYGLLRVLTFLDPVQTWWAVLLVLIGLSSGILGVLFALAQRDLKRMLAYSSVENIGIIALGMGVGVWGMSQGQNLVAVLGFSGAALHVVNHAASKGLLFLGAGSVLHGTGHRDMDRMGGLFKRMPVTASSFLIGAAAIAGLPPLNGFVGEFFIFLGALRGTHLADAAVVSVLVAAFVGLALIGALALAFFSKAFGIVFLGAPRSEQAAKAHEPRGFLLPLLVLAAVCLFIGILSPVAVRVVLPVASQLTGVGVEQARQGVASLTAPLGAVMTVTLVFLGLAGGVALLRLALLSRRQVGSSVTWDCGYERTTTRMQYTSSSFAQPLVHVFRKVLQPRRRVHPPHGYFPPSSSFHSETPDIFVERLYRPAVAWADWAGYWFHWLQQGRVHLYILYIFLTLVILLLWRLGL